MINAGALMIAASKANATIRLVFVNAMSVSPTKTVLVNFVAQTPTRHLCAVVEVNAMKI